MIIRTFDAIAAAMLPTVILVATAGGITTATTAIAAGPPGFTTVTSLTAAKRLAKQGELVPIFVFPTELGGADAPVNIVYVPPVTRDTVAPLIDALRLLRGKDEIDRLTVDVDYRGASVIPTALHYHATHHSKTGRFDPTIRIW